MIVKDILDTKGGDVVTVDVHTTVHEVGKLLTRKNIGSAVVTERGKLVGVVAERDIVQAMFTRGTECLSGPVADLVKPAVTCTLGESIHDLMATMTERRVRHVPVLDGNRLVGLVSIGDVVKHRLQEIQEEAQGLRDYITAVR